MPTEAKKQQVAEITEAFQEASACWFVDACGLTVKESRELRNAVREAGGHMHVYKNTLAAIALRNLGYPELPNILAGPTAFVFTGADVAAPAKAIKEFMDDHENLQLKGGLLDGAEVSVEEALKIAELPSKEQLMAMLASAIQAPITGLARVVNAPIESLARAIKAVSEKEAA